MANKFILFSLSFSVVLSTFIYFLYRGYNWPLGVQGIEALGVISILIISTLAYIAIYKKTGMSIAKEKFLKFGLLIGLLWTVEIAMNNILVPPLPARDIYDDIFWAIITILLFILSLFFSIKTGKIRAGIKAGAWIGFSSGVIACLTALIFIVFGMNFILRDPLNIIEWAQMGPTSDTPSMAVYFAYQTLAGAIMHLVILGIIMGFLVGTFGGLIGKLVVIVKNTNIYTISNAHSSLKHRFFFQKLKRC